VTDPSTLPERILGRISARAVRAGVAPGVFGYRSLDRLDPREAGEASPARKEVLLADGEARYALPANVADPSELPDDRGWWGFSFRDVPRLSLGEVGLVRVEGGTVLSAGDTEDVGYYPVAVTPGREYVGLPEMYYKPALHAPLLRGPADVVLDEAVWVAERAYYNHSHWLRSHLTKFALLQQEGLLERVVLPEAWRGVMRPSLERLGVDAGRIQTVPLNARVDVGALTLVQTSWRRPELVGAVRAAFDRGRTGGQRGRRIYISRARVPTSKRRLLNEDDVWLMFRAAGFEAVCMEDHTFDEQVALMQSAEAVGGLHGAGLTNITFCTPGTEVVEIADLSFPNPNFYALASALGHRYWLVGGTGHGGGHPLYRDAVADLDSLRAVLSALG
jgi:hypothetical protein